MNIKSTRIHLPSFWTFVWMIIFPKLYIAQDCGVAQNLSTAQESNLQLIYNNLAADFQNQNYTNVVQLNLDAISILSDQAGIPEVIEDYVNLTQQATWLNLTQTLDLTRQFIDANETSYADLWKLAKGMKPSTYLPHSLPLRASAEMAAALLKMAAKESDLTRKTNYITWATKALDSLATMQLSSGAFPFPDLRSYNDPVFAPIIQNYLNALGPDSVNVLQNGWIIDDSGTGEFKFDAGVISNAFYEAYNYTGNENYKTVCINIAEYLLNLKLNTNYNYNSFVCLGLTRGFQLTNNTNYLNQAILNVEYGILPGQLENGRWMDGHNAKSVYHNIIIKNCAPLLQSLTNTSSSFDMILNMEIKAIRNLLNYSHACGAATGFEWLVGSQLAIHDYLPLSLNDSIQELIGRHIQQASTNYDFLEIESLGMYIELLGALADVKDQAFTQLFQVFPNPVNSILTIDLPAENTEVLIYDLVGQQMMHFNASNRHTIDVKQFHNGIYLLNISNSEGSYSIKIEKE